MQQSRRVDSDHGMSYPTERFESPVVDEEFVIIAHTLSYGEPLRIKAHNTGQIIECPRKRKFPMCEG